MQVTLSLSEQELQAFVGLMDAGCKALGLSAAAPAARLQAIIEQAVAEARKAAEAKDNVVPIKEPAA